MTIERPMFPPRAESRVRVWLSGCPIAGCRENESTDSPKPAKERPSNVIGFRGAEPVEIEWTQSMIDEVHGRAFRDLEKGIFDCATMAVIALQLAERAIPGRYPKADRAMFAVFHVADMLKKLKVDYEAAFYAEERGRP
jgi:hypothetical protein